MTPNDACHPANWGTLVRRRCADNSGTAETTSGDTDVTIAILATCGVLTTMSAPNVSANLPTPWIGVWERINIGVFLLWVVVLAAALLPRSRAN